MKESINKKKNEVLPNIFWNIVGLQVRAGAFPSPPSQCPATTVNSIGVPPSCRNHYRWAPPSLFQLATSCCCHENSIITLTVKFYLSSINRSCWNLSLLFICESDKFIIFIYGSEISSFHLGMKSSQVSLQAKCVWFGLNTCSLSYSANKYSTW